MKPIDITSEHDAYISTGRSSLELSLQRAIGAADDALYRVRHLSSDRVYDVEYAESGGDVERMVQQAQDLLSGALAITIRRNA